MGIKQVLSISFLGIATLCCQTSKVVTSKMEKFSGHLQITVTSLNLSEMMSDNDELLLFLYLKPQLGQLKAPFVQQKFVADSQHHVHVFNVDIPQEYRDENILLILLEQDDESVVSMIDSTLRSSYQEISQEFAARNYSGIEKYLGDNDVLAIRNIPGLHCDSPNLFHIEGFYKADKYEYKIEIECR